MRFNYVLVCALTMLATVISQAGTMTGGAGFPDEPSPFREIRAQSYLHDCPDVLKGSPTSQGIIQSFAAAASNENQVLQLLYNGGLIFSRPYAEAFRRALNVSSRDIGSKAFGRRLDELMKSSPEQLIQFAWSILDTEPSALFVNLSGDENYTSEAINKKAFERMQARQLIDALKNSPHPEAVKSALLDVTTQSLVALTRAHFLARAKKWESRAKSWNEDFANILSTSLIVGGTAYLDAYFIEALKTHSPLPAATLFFGGITAYLWNEIAIGHVRNAVAYFMAKRYVKMANKFQRAVYVLPKSSGVDRFELGNVIEQFDSFSSVAIPSADLCESNICKLNPVQVAFLGELDIYRLQEYSASFRKENGRDSDAEDFLAQIMNKSVEKLEAKFEFLERALAKDNSVLPTQREFLLKQIRRNIERLEKMKS